MYKRLINQTHGDLRVKFIKCSPLYGRLERNLYDIDVASESHCPSPECIIKSFSAYIYDVWGEDRQRCCVIGERRNGLEDICASWTFHIYSVACKTIWLVYSIYRQRVFMFFLIQVMIGLRLLLSGRKREGDRSWHVRHYTSIYLIW